jgi:hypothetical protein
VRFCAAFRLIESGFGSDNQIHGYCAIELLDAEQAKPDFGMVQVERTSSSFASDRNMGQMVRDPRVVCRRKFERNKHVPHFEKPFSLPCGELFGGVGFHGTAARAG